MILALLLAAATPAAAAVPATPLSADAAEARAATTRSRVLWGIGGNLRLKSGDPVTAAKDFDQALAIPGGADLERGELLLDRARAAQAAGDIASAEARAAEAARLVPGDPFLWYFRTTLAVAANDVPRARLAMLIAINPLHPEPRKISDSKQAQRVIEAFDAFIARDVLLNDGS